MVGRIIPALLEPLVISLAASAEKPRVEGVSEERKVFPIRRKSPAGKSSAKSTKIHVFVAFSLHFMSLFYVTPTPVFIIVFPCTTFSGSAGNGV